MAVKYVFADGREQECTLPLDTPLSFIDAVISSGEQGVISVEILSVSKG